MVALSFILKHWKESAIVLLIILLSTGYGVLTHYKNRYEEEKSNKENLIKLTSGKDLIIKRYQNKNDNLVVRAQQLEFENKTIKTLAEEGQLTWLKEFEGLKKNMKNLESAYKLQAKATDSVKAKLEELEGYYINDDGDTVLYKGMKFNFQDKFTTLKARQISPDSISVTYNIEVPLAGAVFWKRKWFLGKKQYYSEMSSENPNVVIDSVISLTAKKRK